MPEQLKTLLILTCVILGSIILWAISIGVTYWDAGSRRKLPGVEVAGWVALVVLVPGIGFGAYLFGRVLGRLLSRGGPAGEDPRRVTVLKRQAEPEWRTGTIPAADFVETTSLEVLPVEPTRAELGKTLPSYKLTIIAGPHTGLEFKLDGLPARIGRGMEVSIPLNDDQGVSRLHAEIYEQAGVLRIRDLKSTHGTRVNEVSISDNGLDPGDRIRVGMSILVVGVQEEEKR